MASYVMLEQYGLWVGQIGEKATQYRSTKPCPFVSGNCNKKGGVCSLAENNNTAIVCPRRFAENGKIYEKVAEIAFGSSDNCKVLNEVEFLIPANGSKRYVGKIDNIIVKYDGDEIADWCALEIQAVYFSGAGMKSEIDTFVATGKVVPPVKSRRPDVRSSATKRLLPQLEIKVPSIRRWGKKMFIVVDAAFFDWMPPMTVASDLSNSDVCWTVFDLEKTGNIYSLEYRNHVMATLENSSEALIAGHPVSKSDFEKSIQKKAGDVKNIIWQKPGDNWTVTPGPQGPL
jgi:hypothetical protein